MRRENLKETNEQRRVAQETVRKKLGDLQQCSHLITQHNFAYRVRVCTERN
jgi:hypothetical protein